MFEDLRKRKIKQFEKMKEKWALRRELSPCEVSQHSSNKK